MQVLVVFLACFAAFGGFMFGYDIGVINGVKDMDGFRRAMNLSLVQDEQSNGSLNCGGTDTNENALLGLVVSLFSIGCFIGALVSGALSDPIGRKLSIIVGGVVFFIGGALQAASFYLWMVLVGRMVAGIGVGILSMIVPVYNAELAPKALRGRLVSLNQLFITAGIMISFCVSVAVHTVDFGWRIALGLQCVLAVVLIIGMVFLPETPRWLVKKGKSNKADKTLHRLRKDHTEEEIKEELNDIEFTVLNSNNSLSSAFNDIFRWRILERILLGVVLQMFQQFTGMNVIMYYSTSIFCSIDVSSYAATAIVGVVNFLTTLITVFVVDKVGRKSLLLVGALGMCVSILIAGLIIHFFNVDGEREGGGGTEEERQIVGYFVALLIVLFVSFFASTWGPVVWVVTSEIFPLSVRGVAVSVTTSGNWIGNFVVAMVTPLLLGSVLKTAGTFYILAGFLFASFLFVLLTLPETKGESLERIDQLFLRPWLQRIDLFYYLRCCCPWFNACRVRSNQEEDTVAIVGIKKDNKDDTSDEAEDDENESLIKDADVLESSLSAKFDK